MSKNISVNERLNKELSVIAREALYEYIPEEYLERAREKKKNI